MKSDKGKFDKLLTLFLILIFIAFIVVLGPYVFNYIKSEYTMRKAIGDFEESTSGEKQTTNIEVDTDLDTARGSLEDILNELNSDENMDNENIDDENFESGTSKKSNKTNNNNKTGSFQVIGKIEIPKTNISYPIYGNISKGTLETGVAIAYGPGPNQVGNTVIYGHNFRNGKFFSNNKKLTSGDTIYITDLNGNRLIYRIYSVYITTPTDASYMIRDTAGRREISLQTCTDDNSSRLIIWAAAD